jgi:AcrR family transcriptional regulator
MADRRTVLLDAAIDLLGQQGMHGLTHRALDDAAGLPRGSTSNYFRSRDALLDGVVERFAERERANWEELALRHYPTTRADLARMLAVAAREATERHRNLTLARYALLLEAAIRPSVRRHLADVGERVFAWFVTWMRGLGSEDPVREGSIISNYWTGRVLHQLAVPDPEFDLTEPLLALVHEAIGSPRSPGSPAARA